METEDFAGAGLRFANGALGALLATTAAYPGFPERIELIGTSATAVLFAGSLALHHHDGRVERVGEEQATGAGADPMAFPHDAHRALLADFLDALDQDRDPQASGREALRVHRFIDAVLRSSQEGRAVDPRRGLIRSLPWPTIRRSCSPRSGSIIGTSTIRSAGCSSSARAVQGYHAATTRCRSRASSSAFPS